MNKLEELHIPHAKNWDCYNDEPLKEKPETNLSF